MVIKRSIYLFVPLLVNFIASAAAVQGSWQGKHNAVYFYDKQKPFYAFTNFFHLNPKRGHKLDIDRIRWRSSEHYFQAQKFISNPQIYQEVMNADSSRDAFDTARRYVSYVRADWHTPDATGMAPKDKAMMKVLWEKFNQNPDLRGLLLSTGNKTLIEDSPYDDYWGRGAQWNGKNQLGQMLMYIRWCLQNGRSPSSRYPYVPRGANFYR